MKIVVDEAIPFIKDRLPQEIDVTFLPGNKITAEDVAEADALLVRTRTVCNESLLGSSKVRLIGTATIGTDHIDKPWCEKKGITVKSAPGCNAPGVAQYVLASLLKSGFDPVNHTLGIIGYGNVGQTLANWCKHLGIKILVCDPPRKDSGYDDVNYLSTKEVLEHSDAVSLHVPLTKTGFHPTFHLISRDELEILKEGAILVNSSRGGVVDEKALKKLLKEGKIKAVIDVWENEPEIDTELLDLVEIGTPHIAGYSEEGKRRASAEMLRALDKIFPFNPDLTELECKALEGKEITLDRIIRSYDPTADFMNLKHDPSEFEKLRNTYSYRHEPLFI